MRWILLRDANAGRVNAARVDGDCIERLNAELATTEAIAYVYVSVRVYAIEEEIERCTVSIHLVKQRARLVKVQDSGHGR